MYVFLQLITDGSPHKHPRKNKNQREEEKRMPADTCKIKGPDNPTSQLLPIMSTKGCSGDGAGRKDKGGGERSKS